MVEVRILLEVEVDTRILSPSPVSGLMVRLVLGEVRLGLGVGVSAPTRAV